MSQQALSQQGEDATTSVASVSAEAQDQQLLVEISKTQNTKETTAAHSDSGAAPASSGTPVKIVRKRTKTGCLTCRGRRIKCGEERPICANCVKSKRNCEGYNQRVVFKDGMNSLRSISANGALNTAPGQGIQRRYHPYPIQPAPPNHHTLQQIAPAPPSRTVPTSQTYLREDQITPLDQTLPPHLRSIYNNNQTPSFDPPTLISQLASLESDPHLQDSQNGRYNSQSIASQTQRITPPSFVTGNYSYPPVSASASETPNQPASSPSQRQPYNGINSRFVTGHVSIPANGVPLGSSLDQKFGITVNGPAQAAGDYTEFSNYDENFMQPTGTDSGQVASSSIYITAPEESQPYQNVYHRYQDFMPHREVSEAGRAEDEEEEDDEDYAEDIHMELAPRVAISSILCAYAENKIPGQGHTLRSFLPDEQTLATYYPSLTSSPLMNPTTAQIFCHFVYVVGPSISIFERHPPNPSVAFTPGAGLHGPQNVWSYTIPMLSLSHPPLLHAILALSSLHIAKLTKGPTHPALLHYHIALRRLGKAISDDKRRGHVATLAATLVLAYYETMAAEHEKWASHIFGAKQLLKDINFDTLTRNLIVLEEEEKLQREYPDFEYDSQAHRSQQNAGLQHRMAVHAAKQARKLAISTNVDESLMMYIMGSQGRRKHRGSNKARSSSGTNFSRKDVETFQLQSDLFWWFAKMDVYQSIISANPLTLDYVYWSQCPPRARIGTLGTTFGSSDHLFLLVGRLADFQARDIKRKKLVEKMNGGRWIPPPELGGPPRRMMGIGRARSDPFVNMPAATQPSGMPMPPISGDPYPPNVVVPPTGFNIVSNGVPSIGSEAYGISPGGTEKGRGISPPMFGMIPDPGEVRIPQAFAQMAGSEPMLVRPELNFSNPEELESLTVEAEHEWQEIYRAFQIFQESLGSEYQPLPIEYMPVQSTPFGPAIYYRTYSIAILQCLYLTGLIILQRCHPSMPARAPVAVGVAAPKTARYATDIARITASLVATDPTAPVNPSLGGSLIEASIPLFFAGVQYQEKSQRDWLVYKLREINRLTGWSTASRVLLGCFTAWDKAADFGKGPRYERPPPEDEAELPLPRVSEDNFDTVVEGGVGDPDRNFIWHERKRVEYAQGILGE